MSSKLDLKTDRFPTWCPGCGNFTIWGALKKALEKIDANPENTAIVYGIGCAGNGADFIKTYAFHALHGRAIPVATGVKLANHRLNVIVSAGDGDCYGIGLGHFIHAARRNIDITVISHDNQIYGLTTGQTSPTSDRGFTSKSTPHGALESPINPVALALASGATLVSRGFAGDMPELTDIFVEALEHKGFSSVDVLQPCVTFNKVNTYEWFRERVTKLDLGYDRQNRNTAFVMAATDPLEALYTGCLYRVDRPTYEDGLPQLKDGPIALKGFENIDVSKLMAAMT